MRRRFKILAGLEPIPKLIDILTATPEPWKMVSGRWYHVAWSSDGGLCIDGKAIPTA